MPLPKLGRRLRDQTLHRRLSTRKGSLKNFANLRDATNTLARRVKNMRIRFVKKHIQISINKLRDREQIISQLIHKGNIIQGEVIIYLDDAGTEHLTFFIISKVIYSLCDRGVMLENHFLFLIMCLEQPESMSHMFSRPPFITYRGREEVDGSVLGLVR
jgi:hypothetical protein